jgi:hypothetical protein
LLDLSAYSLLQVNSKAKHISAQKSFHLAALGLKSNQKQTAHSMFASIESESSQSLHSFEFWCRNRCRNHAFFKGNPNAKASIENALAKDHAKTADDSFIEIHKRLRDGDLATAENAREFINSIFNEERYDISRVGRFRFNKRFGKSRWKKRI